MKIYKIILDTYFPLLTKEGIKGWLYLTMFLLILSFTALTIPAKAEDNISITGIVTVKKTGNPIAGATIRIEGTAAGAVTNKRGKFEIKNLTSGKYTLLASTVGYETKKLKIEIKSGEMLNLDISLAERALQMSEVVVSANKRIQAVQEVPVSMSVIDSRSLLDRGITKIEDALGYVPGVTIHQDNVDIRGSSGFTLGVGSRVTLLLDGFPLISADNGDIKFDALPLFNIERIEIVKGAGSALYGTSALGGVINVITREPSKESRFRARVFGGIYTEPLYKEWDYTDSPHTKKGFEASYSQKFGNLGVTLSGGITDDESYRLYDDSFRWHGFTKLKYALSDKTDLSLLANYAIEDRTDWLYWNGLDSAAFPHAASDKDIRFTSEKMSLFASARHIFNQQNFLNIRAGVFRTEFETNHDKSSTDYRQSDANSFNFEAQMNSRIGGETLLTYGIDQSYNTVSANIYGTPGQNISALYAQAELSQIQNFTITAGSRFDYEKTTDLKESTEFSPKLGLLYEFPFELSLRGSIGKGFRAPMVVERYSTVTFGGFKVISNPDLKPETSWSYEIGTSYEFDISNMPLKLDFAVFQNELFDYIEPALLGADIQFQNITRARITGAEIGIKGFFGYFGLETSLTVMDPRNLTADEALKYRSDILWYTRLIIPWRFLEFQADYRFRSEVEEINEELRFAGVKDVDARVPIHLVDARILFNLDKISSIPLRLSFNAQNLFDYYYTEVVGNLGMTRHLSLQVDLKI